MATKIVTKNSSTASAVPTASDLVQGELAVNVADKRLFTEDNAGAIVELGTNPSTIDINAGTIDGTTVGASSASTGAFTTLTATGAFTSRGIDDNADATAITIDSSENVGIGGSTITDVNLLNIQGSGASKNIGVVFNDTNTSKIFAIQNGGSALKFFDYTASAERMRIDSSGNLLVGKTAANFTVAGHEIKPNGFAGFTRDGGSPVIVNRLTNDGDLIEFYRGATTVGRIGTQGGDLYLGTDDANIKFFNSASIQPVNSVGGARDNAIDIGASSARFKNLYLSGGVYANNASGAFLWNASNAHIAFGTNNTERMRISSAGLVGISTSAPKSSLEVKGTFGAPATSGSAAGFISRFSQTSGVGSLDFGFGDPYSWIQSRASNNYATNFDLALQPNGGNVGIGTSSPNAVADLHVADTSDARIWLDATSADTMELYSGTGVGMFNRSNSYLMLGTNNAERMRIDSSGNVLVGHTGTADSVVDNGGQGVSIRPTDILIGSTGACLYLNREDSDGILAAFRKDGTTVGSIGTLNADPWMARANGCGVRFITAAWLPTNNTGNDSDNTVDLGMSNVRFDDIYATNGTIQTSDRNEKQDIAELSDAEQRVAVACKGLLRKFRWKDSVAEKGDEARTHFGIIAQDLQAAFEAEGLDAGDYAMFMSDTWTDEETNEEKTRMGVRYSELLAFIISAI